VPQGEIPSWLILAPEKHTEWEESAEKGTVHINPRVVDMAVPEESHFRYDPRQ
jgi:hypothetical protein